MRSPRPTRSRRAFTLLELMATVIVLSIIMVVVLPVISTSVSRYVDASTERANAEHAAYAIDRLVRVLREAPVDNSGQAEMTTLASSELVFSDGSGVRLSGTDLLLIEAGGATNTLCRNVTTLELTYHTDDGSTATSDLGEVWSIRARLVAGGVEMRSHAFVRERIGGG